MELKRYHRPSTKLLQINFYLQREYQQSGEKIIYPARYHQETNVSEEEEIKVVGLSSA